MARTILVPLDATSESATVLDTIRELARSEGATVRLLHVAPPPGVVMNDEGHVIAYGDQETDRVEHKITVFLKSLLGRLATGSMLGRLRSMIYARPTKRSSPGRRLRSRRFARWTDGK